MKDKAPVGFGGKVVTFLLVALFAVYFVYQAFAALMPLTTGTAVYYSAYDGIQTTGMIIRDERVITSDVQGVRYYTVADGEKVSKNGIIANLYNSQQDVQFYSDMNALAKKLASISEVQSYNNTEAVDIDLLNTKINTALLSLIGSCQDGVFDDSAEYSAELLKLLNRKKIATGEEQDYSAIIASLQAQYDSLSASAPAAVAGIYSDASGYFVSTADGLESVLTPDTVDSLTPSLLDGLSAEEPAENTVGKIVSDYTWYIACTVTLKEAANFKVGDTATVKTTLKSADELKVTVDAVNLGDDDRAVLVFACQNMNGDLAAMRTLPITLVTGTYEGLRVSNKAVRIVDGKTGVYVISGMQARFVTVEIIHSTDGYTLCKADNNASEDTLRLYDEVIEKGRNIYDGKIIR